ncbi:PAS domain-containing protein [Phototrophicus methaneseepsis]|uniref:protein-glutamate O-methyltransferase n=1 Tax=Phototrophicus methaneseepsis TaxID=2710758 RepID=A0A7S8IEE2_9CHLR|nr:CheR family methyltransferase [Phototrophicus methaneseepsis]QPC81733.1 PAS domain-containing protein [Phototrophicus methaneseepsis]
MTHQKDRSKHDKKSHFPIIALCASAGGLEAYEAFFQALPEGSGMAFIVMQHQTPDKESILYKILQRFTKIPVEVITAGTTIEPDMIYVVPSDHGVTLQNRQFQLSKLPKNRGWPSTIDHLLESLAHDQQECGVGIIFSGLGTDSTVGAQAIRENNGIVIVQDPASAVQDAMPNHIIEVGLADKVLKPSEMPDYLFKTFEIDVPQQPQKENAEDTLSETLLNKVIRRLRRQTGRDFENYKSSTLQRQIARRVATLQLDSFDDYLDYMNQHPEEANHLTEYLLINVTSFFRDPEAFDSLKTNALLPMLRQMDIDMVLRVWVPGCASGEEAVSLAIVIHECLRELDMQEMEVRIFATDINRELIHEARKGIYPLTITGNISEDRLHDHFISESDGYHVRNHISRMIIWSEHNLVEHPPFSQLHFISCRNVLIYFQRQLQDRILSLFQFALRPDGILFLGSSETTPVGTGELVSLDSRQKIYRRTSNQSRGWLQLNQPLFKSVPEPLEDHMPRQQQPHNDKRDYTLQIVKDMLLEYYNPTCIIVDENYQIRYSFGEVDRYLRLIPGESAYRNVLEMSRDGLDIDLTIALHDAFASNEESFRRNNVWVQTNGHERVINLVVRPIHDSQLGNRLKLVIFELLLEGNDLRNVDPVELVSVDSEANSTVTRLRQELDQTRDVLQSTTQALQAKSEELTTSLEEIRSANEEVQTTNEELRTSKEELESMNEGLNTLNTQLIDQNEELLQANDTLHNFMQATEIAMIFLDQSLHIREFTSVTTQIFSLRTIDKGRQIKEFSHNLNYSDLIDDAETVLNTLDSIEKEIENTNGRWYQVRIRPYRTVNHIVDGVVLTFSDITSQKLSSLYQRQLIDTVENSLIELDSDLRVVNASQSFYDTFEVKEEDTIGKLLYHLGNGQWDIPELRHLLTEIIPEQTIVRDYEVTHSFPELGIRTMRLNARQIAELDRILLVITDISA